MSRPVKQDCENRLPSDCWLMIFSLLSDDDLKAVSLSCKAFLETSNSLKKSLKVIYPKISMLSKHLKRFSQLKNIDLFDFEGEIVEAIREIGCSGISLEALGFQTCGLYEELMENLRGWGSNLKALNCKITIDLRGSDVKVILNTLPNLEEVRIEPIHSINAMGFGFELPKLRLLKKIHVYNYRVCDQFVIALSLNCALLKDVTILSSNVTEFGFGHLLRNRPNLEALSLYTSRYAPKPQSSSITIENSISRAKALTSLVLDGTRNTDKVLKAIAKAKHRLNNLGLLSCEDLTVSSLIMVLSNHLAELRLKRVDLSDDNMKLVLDGDVSKVSHIEISKCKLTNSSLFLLMTKCPSLVEIEMHNTKLNLGQPLGNFPLSVNHNIRSLSLNYCYGINDELAKQFGLMFPNLKVLHLTCCPYLTAKGIEAILKSCNHITELNLKAFDKAKMIYEANDSELAQLNLEVLDLSSSNINDEGLAAIAKKCPRLVSLNLSYCTSITSEGIKQVVRNIKTLKCLNMTDCGYNYENYAPLLEWMLSTGNLASLNKILTLRKDFTMKQRDQFLLRGCLLLDGIMHGH